MAGLPVNHVDNHELTTTTSIKLKSQTPIGEGGFGTVYKCDHHDWGLVAVKKLKAEHINDICARKLKQEAILQSKLRHPNITQMMGLIWEPGYYAVVLEHMRYGSLDHFCDVYQPPLAWKLKMIHDIILGVNYLHTRKPAMLHQDLKIQNCLVGESFNVKISDFGLSEWIKYSQHYTSHSTKGGTVTHLPPERWRNINLKPNLKFDVYSFAVLLWEIISGEIPFHGCRDTEIAAAVKEGQRLSLDADCIPMATPKSLVKMMVNSWDDDCSKRPSFSKLKEEIETLISNQEQAIEVAKCELFRMISENSINSLNSNGSAYQNGMMSPGLDALTPGGLALTPDPFMSQRITDPLVSPGHTPQRSSVLATHGNSGPMSPHVTPGNSGPMSPHVQFTSNAEVFEISLAPSSQPPSNAPDLSSGSERSLPPASATAHPCRQRPYNPTNPAGPVQRVDTGYIQNTTTVAALQENMYAGGVVQGEGHIQPLQGGRQNQPSNHTGVAVERVQTDMNDLNLTSVQSVNSFTLPPNIPHSPYGNKPTVDLSSVTSHQSNGPSSSLPVSVPEMTNNSNANAMSVQDGPMTIRMNGGNINISGTNAAAAGGTRVVIHKTKETNGPIVIGNDTITVVNPSRNPASSASSAQSQPKKKKTITVAPKPVTHEGMEVVAQHVGKSWKKLGRKLGFTPGQLDIFESDNRGLYEQIYQMVHTWVQQTGPAATYKVLADALVQIKQGAVAEKLEEPSRNA